MNTPAKTTPIQPNRIFILFWNFFKVGFYTFGGGWSIVAQMQKEYVEKRKWITDEELLNITSVGRSLPGLMIANVSYLFGYQVAGFPGALAAMLGVALPSLIVLTLVTYGYTLVKDNIYVSRAMVGVRAAVVPIILSALTKLRKAALAKKVSYAFLLLAFILYFFFHVSCIWIMVICGITSYLGCSWYQRRKGGLYGSP